MDENPASGKEFYKIPFYSPTTDYFFLAFWSISAAVYCLFFSKGSQLTYVISVMAVAAIVTAVVLFTRIPGKVVVSEGGFSVNDSFFAWNQVNSISFTLTAGKALQTIIVSFNDDPTTLKLYPKYYKERRHLRSLFEKTADDNMIKITVEDHGI